MLTRLEIDNYRCFEGFVWEPAQKQLILGANGCGKSSMMDALVNLRRFVAGGDVEELFPLRERTRSLGRVDQRFALHAEINQVAYCYRLVVGAAGDPARPVIQSETLDCGNGAFRINVEQGTYSALSNLDETEATALAVRFQRWIKNMNLFRLNPLAMDGQANCEDAEPKLDLSNFVAWYRGLIHSHPERADALFESLRESLDGFDSLLVESASDGKCQLNVRFECKDEDLVSFRFDEISDGQRCLICLYAIIHFPLLDGGTVMIDEPEGFIGLREVQPWHMTARDVAVDSHAQLILISHHPELIDQWAPRHGMRFLRDGAGPVHAKPWIGDPQLSLSAGQLVARGWDDD
jgi:AAA domain-containing protein